MRRIVPLLLLLPIAVAPPAVAKGAGPLVRARLEPAGGVTVGEPVRLVVDVLTPTWFLAPPRFPAVEVEAAFVVLQDRSVNLSETIGGEGYSGLQREYLVYPMREGGFTIPPVEVTIVYAVDARPSPPTPVSTKPLPFSASIPAAARGLPSFVSARRLVLGQQLAPRPEGLVVGGALQRTITIEADEAFGMLLPPLPVVAIDGLASYPGPPQVEDRAGERGAARVARRVESVSYRLLRQGSFALPPVEVAWWDVGARRMRRSSLPRVEFSVGPAPVRAHEIPLPAGEDAAAVPPARQEGRLVRLLPWMASGAAGLSLVAWLLPPVARLLGRTRARLGAARLRRLDSEPACFRRVCRAATRGDGAATYRALLEWVGRRFPAGPATLESIAAGDEDLAAEIDRLGEALYGSAPGRPSWTGARLVSRLEAVRRLARPETAAARTGLGPLNPPAEASRGERGARARRAGSP